MHHIVANYPDPPAGDFCLVLNHVYCRHVFAPYPELDSNSIALSQYSNPLSSSFWRKPPNSRR